MTRKQGLQNEGMEIKNPNTSESLFYITFLKETGKLKDQKPPNKPNTQHWKTVKRHHTCALVIIIIIIYNLLRYPAHSYLGKSLQKRFPKSHWFGFRRKGDGLMVKHRNYKVTLILLLFTTSRTSCFLLWGTGPKPKEHGDCLTTGRKQAPSLPSLTCWVLTRWHVRQWACIDFAFGAGSNTQAVSLQEKKIMWERRKDRSGAKSSRNLNTISTLHIKWVVSLKTGEKPQKSNIQKN